MAKRRPTTPTSRRTAEQIVAAVGEAAWRRRLRTEMLRTQRVRAAGGEIPGWDQVWEWPVRSDARDRAPSMLGANQWRAQHDPIDRIAEQIIDADGNIGNPYRAVGLLAVMERDGRITPAMRAAGDRFHEQFQLAALDPIRAADMGRVGGCGVASAYRGSEAAKDAVADALRALGGSSAPAGCCAWYVLGCELSLTQWAQREGWGGRPIRTEVATGVLIGTLGVLEGHFGL